MKPNEYCFLPEGRRCPDIFEQCSFCQWVDEQKALDELGSSDSKKGKKMNEHNLEQTEVVVHGEDLSLQLDAEGNPIRVEGIESITFQDTQDIETTEEPI